MNKPRLGSISYVNSLPVDGGLLSGAVPSPCEILRDVPTRLNEALSDGSLDLSPVSALHYAEHSDELLALPDLSISSRSGVKSVLLISRYPMSKLGGRRIALTSQGKTTPALLKILLTAKHGAHQSEFETHHDAWQAFLDNQADAALVIGDDALRVAEADSSGHLVYDLAEEWNQWTRLPFVFAVWAVRKDFASRAPGVVQDVIQALQDSKRWGAANMGRVIEQAMRQTRLPRVTLERYFDHLCYDYDEDLKLGMSRFVRLAREAGLVQETLNTGEQSNARIVG